MPARNPHDVMRRLLASDLLPQRAGQPVKALVHVHFAELLDLDSGLAMQDAWIAGYRARWAAHRAAASVGPGDGGAWLAGDAARAAVCDAMTIPVVTCDIDVGAVEDLIGLCARYHRIRAQAAAGGQANPDTQASPKPGTDRLTGTDGQTGTDRQAGSGPRNDTDAGDNAIVLAGLSRPGARAAGQAAGADRVGEVLAMLEDQILGTILQVVSGPGGAASFLMGKGLNGPSLPLDIGQSDDIPRICAAWSRCATRPAGTPAGAISPPGRACTIWSAWPTAARPVSGTVPCSAGFTTILPFISGAGR